jgi:hypothetical protein
MDFQLSEEQQMVVRMVREFGQKEVGSFVSNAVRRWPKHPDAMAELGIPASASPNATAGRASTT